ncbi:MAG TPA: hypothetical protein DCZ76_11470 [Treponema sp.]|nr:hypothetical protein [Treponema sp.]
MRVTPPVRCIAKIFSVFAAAFSLAVISCAANDDSASLTIQMPGSSSSRAISSEGHLEALDNFNFSVYIRDSDNEEVEKYTNVAPGTKLTISALRAGNYKVAIRGITGGSVMLYGAADAVVQGGVENTVGIKLKEVNHDGRINFFIETLDSSSKARTEITCKNGDSYSTGIETLSEELGDSGSVYYYQLDNLFFEPGFTYTATIYIYGADGEIGDLYGTYTSSATATKNGIVFTVN